MTKEDKWAMDADKIIDRFIRGEMTEQEERQFHQRMADDKEFASRAQEAALLSKAMGIVGDRRDRAIVSSVSRMSEAEFNAMLSEPGDICSRRQRKTGGTGVSDDSASCRMRGFDVSARWHQLHEYRQSTKEHRIHVQWLLQDVV